MVQARRPAGRRSGEAIEMRCVSVHAAGVGICLIAARVTAAQDERPGARFAVDVTRDVMVPMRDGVRLATDVYRPRGVTDRLPVILIRLPYNKARYRGATDPASFFAGQGYVVAV